MNFKIDVAYVHLCFIKKRTHDLEYSGARFAMSLTLVLFLPPEDFLKLGRPTVAQT